MRLKYVYRQSDGVFLYGGPCNPEALEAGCAVVELSRHPNPKTERFDSVQGIRPALASEIVEQEAGAAATAVAAQFDAQRDVKAVVIWVAQKLNIPLATARQEILAIRRGL